MRRGRQGAHVPPEGRHGAYSVMAGSYREKERDTRNRDKEKRDAVIVTDGPAIDFNATYWIRPAEWGWGGEGQPGQPALAKNASQPVKMVIMDCIMNFSRQTDIVMT